MVQIKNFTKWRIEYDNDTGPNDEGFGEWWDVANNDKIFRSRNKEDAKRLYNLVNGCHSN